MIWQSIKDNPVRIFAIVSAAVALLAYFVPALPVPLVVGLAAAILGVGETVRHNVAPMSKVVVHKDELADFDGAFYVPETEA